MNQKFRFLVLQTAERDGMFPIKILIFMRLNLTYIEIFQEVKKKVPCSSVDCGLCEELTVTLSDFIKRQWAKYPTQHVPGIAGECFSLIFTPFRDAEYTRNRSILKTYYLSRKCFQRLLEKTKTLVSD